MGRINVEVRGNGIAVTPALRNYVTKKLELVAGHVSGVAECMVWLVHEPHAAREERQTARVHYYQAGKPVVHLEKTTADMYHSIEAAMGALVAAVERRRRMKAPSYQRQMYSRKILPQQLQAAF